MITAEQIQEIRNRAERRSVSQANEDIFTLLDELERLREAVLSLSFDHAVLQQMTQVETGQLRAQIAEARRALRFMDMAGVQTALGGGQQ